MYGKTSIDKVAATYTSREEAKESVFSPALDVLIDETNTRLYNIHDYLGSIEVKLARIDGIGLSNENCDKKCDGVDPRRESFLEKASYGLESLEAVQIRLETINSRLTNLIN